MSRDRAAASEFDDYLDARGVGTNMFTGEPYSERFSAAKEAVAWHGLPMYKSENVKLIVESLRKNAVTLLIAGTGAGKTVLAPKIAYKFMKDSGSKGKIVVTNPKRETTRSNAETSAFIADVELGREIGYRFRGSDRRCASAATVMEYVTDGHLLTRARDDRLFSDYSLVLIDEVHERPEPTDFLLLAVRKALGQRGGDLKALIVSATMDSQFFEDYFRASGLDVGVVDVEGTTPKPIDVRWAPVPPEAREYLPLAVAHADAYMADPTDGRGSVLVFVPVTRDAGKGCQLIADACKVNEDCDLDTLLCKRLYAKVSEDEAREAKKNEDGDPRVIFATNVAESSITIDDLKCVIDPGYEYEIRYDPASDAYVAGTVRITRAQAMQRRGRVGRNQSGVCIHMYSEKTFAEMVKTPDPKIATVDLTERVWDMLTSSEYGGDLGGVLSDLAALPTPASDAQITNAKETLAIHGLVDVRTGRVTGVGRNLADILRVFRGQISFHSGLMLMAGMVCGCLEEMAVLVAIDERTKGDIRELWKLKRDKNGQETLKPPKELPFEAKSEHLRLVNCYGWLYKKRETGKQKATIEAIRAGTFEKMWEDIHRDVLETVRRLGKFQFRDIGAFEETGPWNLANKTAGMPAALLLSKLKKACVWTRREAMRLFLPGRFGLADGMVASEGAFLVCDQLVYHKDKGPTCDVTTVFPSSLEKTLVFASNVLRAAGMA